MRIPIETTSDRLLPQFLILQVIVTIIAIALITKLPVRKAITVQFETLRFGTVACFARPQAEVRCFYRCNKTPKSK